MAVIKNMTYETPMYGEEEYKSALNDWKSAYGTYSSLYSKAAPAVGEMTKYYSPGGGYGQGMKQEAEETVQKGVNKDLSQMVASGMSSQAGAKGLQTLASSELGKMYKNIEDTRNELWMQSITPYAQLAESLSQFMSTRPSYKQYVTTPETKELDLNAILSAQSQSIARNQARNTF